MTIREDRLSRLVAVSVKANKTPNTVGFKETIRNACSVINLSKHQIQDMVDTLITIYSVNRWNDLVKNNPCLSESEKIAWLEHD
jgi:hypothetical protein